MGEIPTPETVGPVDEYQRFFEAARIWELQLNDPIPGDEELEELAAAIPGELDPICPYIDQYVSVTGSGIVPILDTEVPQVIEEVYYGEDVQGLHQGVKVVRYQGPEDLVQRPKIMHLILVAKSAGMVAVTQFQENVFLAYFLIEPSTVINSVTEIEEVYGNTLDMDSRSLSERLDLVESYAVRAKNLVCSTGFRRKNQQRQTKMVESLVAEAERVTNLRETEVRAETTHGYVQWHQNENTYLVTRDLLGSPVQGTILGLESLESLRLRKGKTIRRDADLLAKSAGLCLVVSPDDETQARLELDSSQVIYLPLAGKKTQLEFLDTF